MATTSGEFVLRLPVEGLREAFEKFYREMEGGKDPSPGEPKVVGYVGRLPLNSTGNILPTKDDYFCHPVILQSDHEAAVRGLAEEMAAEMSCTDCGGKGWKEDRVGRYACTCISETDAWAERGVEITRLKAENERLTVKLEAAAASLETISQQGGRTEFLGKWSQVRGYANNRARVARDALKITPTPSNTEAESVEGKVQRYIGHRIIWVPEECGWATGTPVKITRIPTPGGDDDST